MKHFSFFKMKKIRHWPCYLLTIFTLLMKTFCVKWSPDYLPSLESEVEIGTFITSFFKDLLVPFSYTGNRFLFSQVPCSVEIRKHRKMSIKYILWILPKILKTTIYNVFKLVEHFQSHIEVFSSYFRVIIAWPSDKSVAWLKWHLWHRSY